MFLFKRRYWSTDPQTGARVHKKTKNWYGRLRDADGIKRRVPLCPDKAASATMLAELRKRALHQKAGLVDPFDAHCKRSLSHHVTEFEQHLRAKHARTRHQDRDSRSRGVRRLRIQTPDRTQRRSRCVLAGRTSPAERRRKGQRHPRLGHREQQSLSGGGEVIRSVAREGSALPENPFAHLSRLNASVDVRRERRSLSEADFGKLLQATRDNGDVCGLSSEDRERLYFAAAYTGFRANELASLTTSSFDFATDSPTVTVEAGYSKHRRKDVVPLCDVLIERLQPWIATLAKANAPVVLSIDAGRASKEQRPSKAKRQDAATVKLWPGAWAKNRHGAEMIRADLDAAGIPFEDDQGRVFDFHALRGQFITTWPQRRLVGGSSKAGATL